MKRGSSRSAPAATRWIDRWLDACSDLADLARSNPMTDAVIDEIDGRMIRIGDAWLADFASCNYLGFDLEREIIDAVPEYLDAWGTHPSWSRLLGSPVLYEQIEERLTELLGGEDTLVLPTITLIHMSVIPAARGAAARSSSRTAPTRRSTTAASCARVHGATVKRFATTTRTHLERLLRQASKAPRADLHRRRQQHDRATPPDVAGVRRARARVRRAPVRRRRARVRRDRRAGGGRAQSLRQAGQRDHAPLRRGLRPRRARRGSLEVVLVAGCVPRVPARAEAPAEDRGASVPLLGPVAGRFSRNHAGGLRGQRRRGDAIRADLWKKTVDVLDCLDRIGAHTPNRSGFPIIEVPLADTRTSTPSGASCSRTAST